MSREELVRELRKLTEQEEAKDLARDRLVHDLRVHQGELEAQNRELRETQIALEASRARLADLYDFAPIAYFTFDQQGLVQEVNLTGATMIGLDRAQLIGKPFTALVEMPDQQVFWRHLGHCERERLPVVIEMRFSVDGDEPRDLQVVTVPVLDPTGHPVAFRTSFSDITQLKRAEAELTHMIGEEQHMRRRFEELDRASLALNQVLARVDAVPATLPEILQAIVNHARTMTDAEFAAVGIGSDLDRPFDPWNYSGLDPVCAIAIGRPPCPRGVLGEVVRVGHSSRLRDLRVHPAFAGFPPNHPEMRSFLGVPVHFGGRTIGNLYLTNKRSAAEFSEDDQRMIEMFAERAGIVMEIARFDRDLRSVVAARDNLLAIVSHDLRGPLATILLSAELEHRIRQRSDPQGQRNALDTILRAAGQMHRLLEDLLQAATIEAGTFAVEMASHDVRSLIAQALELLEPLAANKAIHLESEVPEGLLPIRCDDHRVVQVLCNLIGNAIKFTSDGGRIQVRASMLAQEIQIAVSDSGPGIAVDQISHLFDRYWKGSTERRRGTGLGLYIAKGIVEAHDGRIWAESQLGAGSTFCFTLPIAQSQPSSGTS
jgi:PAS domain S-box-containing protein